MPRGGLVVLFRVSIRGYLVSRFLHPLLTSCPSFPSFQAAPNRPSFRVDLGKGTVTIENPKDEAAKRALAVATAGDQTGRPASAVRPRDVKLKGSGNCVIAAMTEEDCVDATKLIMALFFKTKPQDYFAKDRLKAEQAERVYGGLAFGVRESDDRLLLCAKVGGNLVGVAEVALPNGKRVGGYSSYEPTAPGESPYVSDVCVAPNQRGRGIGKSLLRACEAAMVARGAKQMYLHAKTDNEEGKAMFVNAGYTEVGRSGDDNPLASFGIGEVGHALFTKQL